MSTVASLVLKANPKGWSSFVARKQDKAFLKLAESVWKRDRNKCQYCGVVMKGQKEVINLDGCYTNNASSNLMTACIFCTQCGFLESIGPGIYGGGTLVYLPEMNQNFLNGLCYTLFSAMEGEIEEEEMLAQQFYRSLSMRAQLVEKNLGEGMSDPAVFGQLLVESGLPIKPNTLPANLRLLPMRSASKTFITSATL